MDDSAPERIEIELTSNAGAADRRHRRPAVEPTPGAIEPRAAVDGSVGLSTPAAAAGRRQLVITSAIVGVVALLLGWLLGRAGEADEAATTGTATVTTTAVATATVTSAPEGEALPLPPPPPTTARPPRTTVVTTLPPPSVDPVDVDARLAGTALTLVGTARGNLLELDLVAQTLTESTLGMFGSTSLPMIVGSDWVVVSSDSGQSRVVHADGRSEPVSLGDPWQLMWQVGTDRFWRPTNDNSNGNHFGTPSAYEEIDVTGAQTGARIELPPATWPWQVDPAGGLIVSTVGKIYSIDQSSTDLIGSGELVGLSSEIAVTKDCDAQLRCGWFVTDRATGSVRAVGAEGDDVPADSWFGWAAGPGAVSPDGTSCLVVAGAYDLPTMGLLDLTDGTFTPLTDQFDTPSIVWSPEGRFAFFVGGSDGHAYPSLHAVDRQTGDVFPVLTEHAPWSGVSTRPPVAG